MQTNINTVPAPVLDGVATILKPYGVDIVALLNRQQDDAAPTVEPLKKKYLTRAENGIAASGAGRCGKRNEKARLRRQSWLMPGVAVCCMIVPVSTHGSNPA